MTRAKQMAEANRRAREEQERLLQEKTERENQELEQTCRQIESLCRQLTAELGIEGAVLIAQLPDGGAMQIKYRALKQYNVLIGSHVEAGWGSHHYQWDSNTSAGQSHGVYRAHERSYTAPSYSELSYLKEIIEALKWLLAPAEGEPTTISLTPMV